MSNFGDNHEVERRILLALEAFKSGKFVKLSHACEHYFVPYHRAYGRLNGKPSKVNHPPTHQKLSLEQEEALINYIKRCDECGFSAFPSMIHDAAFRILNAGLKPPSVLIYLGRDWVTRWLKAHLELHKQKQKAREVDRIEASEYTALEDWYRKFERVVNQYGILPSDY